MRVTITQIAEAAGVSRGTVDKVLHGRSGVSDEVRANVQRILREMDYRPNQSARALRCARQTALTLLVPPVDNLYHRAVLEGAKRAEEDHADDGLQLNTVVLGGFGPDDAVRALEPLLASGAEGVILQGVADPRVGELIGALSEAGKAVVLYDSDIADCGRLCFVGEDHILSGRIAGSLLAKCLRGSGRVLVVGGARGSTSFRLRLEGFLDTVRLQYSGIEIVRTIETDEDNLAAYQETVAAIAQQPDLQGIFVVTGCSAGVARAVIETKKAGDIKIVGYNITDDVAAMVKLGIVDFAINTSPYQQGYIATRELFAHLLGTRAMSPRILIPSDIGIAENIDYLIRAEWNKVY